MQMKFPITVIYLDKKDKLKILYDTLVTFRFTTNFRELINFKLQRNQLFLRNINKFNNNFQNNNSLNQQLNINEVNNLNNQLIENIKNYIKNYSFFC
jgi:hypothetical protein